MPIRCPAKPNANPVIPPQADQPSDVRPPRSEPGAPATGPRAQAGPRARRQTNPNPDKVGSLQLSEEPDQHPRTAPSPPRCPKRPRQTNPTMRKSSVLSYQTSVRDAAHRPEAQPASQPPGNQETKRSHHDRQQPGPSRRRAFVPSCLFLSKRTHRTPPKTASICEICGFAPHLKSAKPSHRNPRPQHPPRPASLRPFVPASLRPFLSPSCLPRSKRTHRPGH